MDALAEKEPIRTSPGDLGRQEADARRRAQPEPRQPEDRQVEELEPRVRHEEIRGRRDGDAREADGERRPEARAEGQASVAVDDDAVRRARWSLSASAERLERLGVRVHVSLELELAHADVDRHLVGPHAEVFFFFSGWSCVERRTAPQQGNRRQRLNAIAIGALHCVAERGSALYVQPSGKSMFSTALPSLPALELPRGRDPSARTD